MYAYTQQVQNFDVIVQSVQDVPNYFCDLMLYNNLQKMIWKDNLQTIVIQYQSMPKNDPLQ